MWKSYLVLKIIFTTPSNMLIYKPNTALGIRSWSHISISAGYELFDARS